MLVFFFDDELPILILGGVENDWDPGGGRKVKSNLIRREEREKKKGLAVGGWQLGLGVGRD